MLIALKDVAIAGLEQGIGHDLALDLGDLGCGWPDVLQEDRVAILIRAKRLGGQVKAHRACQGIGHDQGRRGQIIGARIGIDPALEIAIARQDRDRNQITVLNGLGHSLRQGPGIANTGGAAITHQVKAKRI